MGMSTHVVGIKPPDEKWRRMKAVYDACVAGGVMVPQEVWTYFNDEPPDEAGVTVNLDKCTREYKHEMSAGYEIDMSKVPADVRLIRFYNSW